MKFLIPHFVLFCLVFPSSGLFAAQTVIEDFANSSLDTRVWTAADGWTNGEFTSTFWSKEQVAINDGRLLLTLSAKPCLARASECKGKSNAGAEVRSKQHFGYGEVSASMKAAKGKGLITALFKYTGPYDGDPHDEVDIEILGKDPTKAQLNYWVNGKSKLEKVISLGFDSSLEFHRYGWKQSPTSIVWTIDGKEVHRVTESDSRELPSAPGKVMVSLWAAQPGTGADTGWAGDVTNTALPVSAHFEWIRVEP